ncbi:hypothetical protein [Rubritalea marina]|uniref:hypothetical protein n=1 Tax=Rubritalea marina TaxID=361055 RepID=UPI000375D547|nr:hypothetical protein [Rubritalea marina]
MRIFVSFILTLVLTQLAFANGKKQPPVTVTFHTEATDIESKKLAYEIDTPKGKHWMSKSPFITTSDITAYFAFVSPHNPDLYGVSFQLSRGGASRLSMTSGQHAGKWVMCAINGKVVDMLYIDRQVDGRVITIWRGVDSTMLEACNQLIPKIGESQKAWKTRLKYENKQRKE